MNKTIRPRKGTKLREWYDDLNDGFFGNKLPRVPVLKYGKPRGGKGVMASTMFYNFEPQEIIVRRDLGSRTSLLALVHEMVHVKLRTYHRSYAVKYGCKPPKHWNGNTPWPREIRRLARLGLFDYLV